MSRLHQWSWSGLDLTTADQPNSGFWFQTFADGFDLGQPEGVRVVRESLLLDGDDSTIERWGNRTVTFQVAVYGYSNADLNDGERELAYRVGGTSVLAWVPPQSGAESWYLVRTSSMKLSTGGGLDLQWVQPGVRYQVYTVTADCAPFAMSPDLVEENFTPGSASTSVINNASSATNWPGMTTTTHLGEAAVQTALLTATAGSAAGVASGGSGGWVWSAAASSAPPVSPSVGTTIQFNGAIGAVNFVYVDLAFTVSGYSGTLGSVFMRGTQSGVPAAQQLLANGYTRYFWTKPLGSTVFLDVSLVNMNAGDTGRFFVNEIGSSNLIPAGSMFGVSTIGSVRMPARLRIGHPTNGQGVGETFIYSDASMMSYGWNPGNQTTYQYAPEGSYYVYVQPDVAPYAVGTTFSLTLNGQTKTTRSEWAGVATPANGRWFPIGPFHLGGNLSRRLGTVTGISGGTSPAVSLDVNGVSDPGNPARLFRVSEDSELFHVRATTTGSDQYVFIDPASFDTPKPGVFSGASASGAGATSLLSLTDSWSFPTILPPLTVFWLQCGNTTSPSLRAIHRPLFHTMAAKALP
jgi:hypothetical protein